MNTFNASTIITRRSAIIGASSFAIVAGNAFPAAAIVPAWFGQVAMSLVSGYLVESLKNWGLVYPQPVQNAAVPEKHGEATSDLNNRGYATRRKYCGPYSAGEVEVTEGIKHDDYCVSATSSHAAGAGLSTCTISYNRGEIANLNFVTAALRRSNPHTVQAASMPIHTDDWHRPFDGTYLSSPTYMTPSHGAIRWTTNVRDYKPNMLTEIESPATDIKKIYVWKDNDWQMRMQT